MNIDSNHTNAPSDSLLERLERSLIAGRMSRRGFMRAATAAGFASVGLSALAGKLDAIRANQNERIAKLQAAYDYVVVGTGSAACALVGRLATRKDGIFGDGPQRLVHQPGLRARLERPGPGRTRHQ